MADCLPLVVFVTVFEHSEFFAETLFDNFGDNAGVFDVRAADFGLLIADEQDLIEGVVYVDRDV